MKEPASDAAAPTELAVESFRDYLLLLARMHVKNDYHGKFDASDIVQQTMMEAHRKRDQFRGSSSSEFAGWLRQMLSYSILDAMRAAGRAKRDLERERALQAALDTSGANLENWLAADQSTPSMRVEKQEQILRMIQALAQLPEGQRDVLVMKHCQNKSLTEIGEKLGITPPSVIGLLKRGTEQLRKIMRERDER